MLPNDAQHEHGVIHRALNFEAIVFEHSGPNAAIKVTDFGLAKRLQPNRTAQDQRLGVASM